jgi:prevent-host-death family protein
MVVTATEFKTNIGKYLSGNTEGEIVITKNGKGVAKLTYIHNDTPVLTKSLRGVIKGADVTLEGSREERLGKYK